MSADEKPGGGPAVDIAAIIKMEIERAVSAALGKTAPSRPSFTIDNAIDLYIRLRVPEHKVRSGRSARSRFRSVSRELGKIETLDLTYDRLSQYREDRVKQGVTHSTSGQELVLLRAALNLGVEAGSIPYNPMQRFRIKIKGRLRNRVYLPEEVDAMLDAALRFNPPLLHTYAVILIMRDTGIRPIELISSRAPNLNWATGSLFIPEEVAKTGTSRWCKIRAEGLAALKALAVPGCPFLFPPIRAMGRGHHFAQSALNKQFRKICDVAEIAPDDDGKPADLYSLRGTLATRLGLDEGYEMSELMAAMGWTNSSVARRYVRTGERQILEQAARLEAVELARKLEKKRAPATVTYISSGRKKAE